MNEWDERAEYYRASWSHATGDDLDQLVAWCEPGPDIRALDVASGGGHVARRLRELGCTVTTCDAAPGMEPDVVCPAELLPFPDASFDVVACRLAVHHFDDARRAMAEMARVTAKLVVIEDTLFIDDRVQQAEKLRDATHVRHYPREAFDEMLQGAGLRVTAAATFAKRHDMADWLLATGCGGETALHVRKLLAHVSDGGGWTDRKLVLRAEKAG